MALAFSIVLAKIAFQSFDRAAPQRDGLRRHDSKFSEPPLPASGRARP